MSIEDDNEVETHTPGAIETRAQIHKYSDNGLTCFSNVTLADGVRVLVSIASTGLQVRRLHLGGVLPGRLVFGCDRAGLMRISAAIEGAGYEFVPDLPEGPLLTDMTQRIENGGGSGLSDVTRFALAAKDHSDFARLLGRAANTA